MRSLEGRALAGYGLRGSRVGEARHPGSGYAGVPWLQGRGPWTGEWHMLHLSCQEQGTWDCFPMHEVRHHTLSGVLRGVELRGYCSSLNACCHGDERGAW